MLGRRLGNGLGILALCAAAVPAWPTEYIARDQWPDIDRGIQVTQYAKLAGVVNEVVESLAKMGI